MDAGLKRKPDFATARLQAIGNIQVRRGMMKRYAKIILMSVIMFLAVIFITGENAYASYYASGFIGAYDKDDHEEDDFRINIRMVFEEGTERYNVNWDIQNKLDKDADYILEIELCDDSHLVLATSENRGTVEASGNIFDGCKSIQLKGYYSKADMKGFTYRIWYGEDGITKHNVSVNDTEAASKYSGTIQSCHIDMIVNENNTYDVKETITVKFYKPTSYVNRRIRAWSGYQYTGGTCKHKRIEVSDVSVEKVKYEFKKNGGEYLIKIGEPDIKYSSESTFVIRYKYNAGQDYISGYDEFFFMIANDSTQTDTGNISFNITFPKDFDTKNISFIDKSLNIIPENLVSYTVSGRTVSGTYEKVNEKGDFFAIRCVLPDGYFKDAGFKYSIFDYAVLWFPLLMLIVSIVLIVIKGSGERPSKENVTDPPKGITALEAGFIFKGAVSGKDVASVLFNLANKGYIAIERDDFEPFRIVKLKEYEGRNRYEAKFMELLFLPGQTVTTGGEFAASMITAGNDILSEMKSPSMIDQIYDKGAAKLNKIIIGMTVAAYAVMCIQINLKANGLSIALFSMAFGIGGLFFLFNGLKAKRMLLVMVPFTSVFIGTPFFMANIQYMINEKVMMICYIGGFIAFILMILLQLRGRQRTQYGRNMYAKLNSFKTYLEKMDMSGLAEKNRQDPDFIINTMPYAYVLKADKGFVKMLDTVSINIPSWFFNGDSGVNAAQIYGFMCKLLDRCAKEIR